MRFRSFATCVTALMAAMLPGVPVNGQGFCFKAAVSYTVGSRPCSVFAADLDSDGDQDLVVANEQSGNVSVLKNNGDGTFAAAVNYAAGRAPQSVLAADLDGDGDRDLVMGGNGGVSVLKNNGDGTFGPAVNYTVGDGPVSVFAADLDGDGDKDLAVATGCGDVSVLKNSGNGTFAAAVNYTAGSFPASIYAADLDGDGDQDLVVGCVDYFDRGSVSVLKNNGDGAFAAAVSYAVGIYPRSVFAADLNGDGKPDLAVANQGSRDVSVLENNGNGTFAAAVNYAVGTWIFSVVAADLDGDGNPDLAVANGSYNVSVLKNNGNGTFAAAMNYAAGSDPVSVFAADLDGDGDLDLAVANSYSSSGSVSVLINCGSPYRISIDLFPHMCPNIITTDLLEERAYPRLQPGVPAPSPNPAVIPVAILGSRSFNTHQCDPTTARLEGAAPQRWEFSDVGQPVIPSESECDCPLSRADGFADLVLYFDQGEVLNALRPWRDGDRRGLHLMVGAKTGAQYEGSDCVTIREVVPITPARAEPAGAATPTSLRDCWPNPFNGATTISYTLAEPAFVSVEVFDVLGRKVRTLFADVQESGPHAVAWNGADDRGASLASGVFFCRLRSGAITQSRKMIMLK